MALVVINSDPRIITSVKMPNKWNTQTTFRYGIDGNNPVIELAEQRTPFYTDHIIMST